MQTPRDFPAVGRIIAVKEDGVTFVPINTNYELELAMPGGFSGEANERIEALIRVRARKVYTVPTGGNFVSPIFGPPRTLQGRVRYLSDDALVLQCGMPVLVELPSASSAIDLAVGKIQVGALVNVAAYPGGTLEVLNAATLRQSG